MSALKLPLAWPEIRKASKTMLARICSRQRRELIALRSEVAALREAIPKPPAPPPATEREAAKAKLVADIAGAKIAHAEFMAKEAAEAPERARKLAEWRAEEKDRKRARDRELWNEPSRKAKHNEKQRGRYHANPAAFIERSRQWALANPEKVRKNTRESQRRRRERLKAAKEHSTDLLQSEESK